MMRVIGLPVLIKVLNIDRSWSRIRRYTSKTLTMSIDHDDNYDGSSKANTREGDQKTQEQGLFFDNPGDDQTTFCAPAPRLCVGGLMLYMRLRQPITPQQRSLRRQVGTSAYNAAIAACGHAGSAGDALPLLTEMEQRRVPRSVITYRYFTERRCLPAWPLCRFRFSCSFALRS